MTSVPRDGSGDSLVFLVLHREDHEPSVPEVARELGIDQTAFDRDFGIVMLDPGRDLWCARVRKGALPSDLGKDAWIAFDPDIQGID